METPPISRSGRVIKKSAKLLEMETETNNSLITNTPKSSTTTLDDAPTNNSGSNNIKMKLNLSGEIQPQSSSSIQPQLQPQAGFVKISDIVSSDNSNQPGPSSITKTIITNGQQQQILPIFQQRTSSGPLILKIGNDNLCTTNNITNNSKGMIIVPQRDSNSTIFENNKRIKLISTSSPTTIQNNLTSNLKIVPFRQGISPIMRIDKATKDVIQQSFISSTPKTSTHSNISSPSTSFKSIQPRSIQEQRRINQANRAKQQQQSQKSTPTKPTTMPVYNHNQALFIEDENSKRKKPAISAYVLWCKEMRKDIQSRYPDLDFASLSKKMGEIWHTLPQNEKNTWFKKAQIMTQHGNSCGSDGLIPLKQSFVYDDLYLKPEIVLGSLTLPITVDLDKTFDQNFIQKNNDKTVWCEGEQYQIGSEFLDVQAYLSILGDSLMTISSYIQRGIKYNSEIRYSESAAVSTLLDTALVSMAAMASLTASLPNVRVDRTKIEKTIENVTYFMPPSDFD